MSKHKELLAGLEELQTAISSWLDLASSTNRMSTKQQIEPYKKALARIETTLAKEATVTAIPINFDGFEKAFQQLNSKFEAEVKKLEALLGNDDLEVLFNQINQNLT